MPRPLRHCPGGYIFHVLNRANSRNQIYNRNFDYQNFIDIVREAQITYGTKILAYCLMPNHWHFLLQPQHDDELSHFIRWISVTHTRRYRLANKSWGEGPLYQGRFKSFAIKSDNHCLIVKRYIERNPLRADLVSKAQDWVWSSLGQYFAPVAKLPIISGGLTQQLSWCDHVNQPQSESEIASIRDCLAKGKPYGDPAWTKDASVRLKLKRCPSF